MSIAMSGAPDAPAGELSHPEHLRGERDDACDEESCIAVAVIPAEGVE